MRCSEPNLQALWTALSVLVSLFLPTTLIASANPEENNGTINPLLLEATVSKDEVMTTILPATKASPPGALPRWEKLNSWEAGTWKRIKNELWDTFHYQKGGAVNDHYVNDLVESSADTWGHILDQGAIWHCRSDLKRWFKQGNITLIQVDQAELEPTKRDKSSAVTHYLTRYKELVDNTPISEKLFDTVTSTRLLHDGLLEKTTESTVTDATGMKLVVSRTKQTWQRVRAFDPKTTTEAQRKSFLEFKKSHRAF